MSTATGYAVYDRTLERFVSGVHPTAKAAEDEVTKVKGHRYTTRKLGDPEPTPEPGA